jgi:hypothetical protein
MRLHTKGRLIAWQANISLEWKQLKVTNTQAYYNTKLIVLLKSFEKRVQFIFYVTYEWTQ